MEKELVDTEDKQPFDSKARYIDISKKFMIVFIILFIIAFSNIVTIVIAIQNKSTLVTLCFGVFSHFINIIYSIVLFLLGKYDSDFGFAGLINIVETLITFINRFCPFSGMSRLFFSFLAIILSFYHFQKFSDAMSSRFLPVDISLSNSWDSFHKVNRFIVIAVSLVYYSLTMISSDQYFYLKSKILIFCVICLIVICLFSILIWDLILLYKSTVTMKAFVNKPDEPPANAVSVMPLISCDNPVE